MIIIQEIIVRHFIKHMEGNITNYQEYMEYGVFNYQAIIQLIISNVGP